jgi:hypothetical protein
MVSSLKEAAMYIYAVGMNGKPYKPKKKLRSWVVIVALTAGLLSIGAVTQINLTTQVTGILPATNGGTAVSSTATFPSSGTVMITTTAVTCSQHPALLGDVTSVAANCTTTAVKINGTSVPTNSAADQVILTTASGTGSWGSVPNTSGTQALSYNTTTHAFGTVTVLSGNFADNETPTGTCPTTGLTLAHTPNPAASLSLFYNGQLLISGGADYTLATAAITLAASCPTGTLFRASYRY